MAATATISRERVTVLALVGSSLIRASRGSERVREGEGPELRTECDCCRHYE